MVLSGLLLSPISLSPFQPQKANAVLGLGDIVVDIQAFADRLWESAKTVIGQQIKKMILDRIVDATVQWIKRGGFEGKGGPLVEDWGALFEDIGNQAVGEIANQAIPELCGNFKLNLALSVTQEPKTFSKEMECSLTDVVDNINDLFEDFKKESKGRWITYNTLWEPQNNYYGSALKAEDKKQSVMDSLTNQKNVEATVNLGFKPQVECTVDKETGKEKCVTVTPGSVIGQQIQQQIMPKDNAILSANDMAAYIGAIADAILYRYSILASGGLKKLLGYTSNDIDKENTNKAWAEYTQNTFSQIDSITFQNNRALFLEEIRSVLAVKRSTVSYLDQSINIENALLASLEPLQNCSLPDGSTSGQSLAMASLPIYIDDTNITVSDLETRWNQTQNEIIDLEGIITDFNQYDYTDNTQMVNQYTALKTAGVLDLATATSALNDSQSELVSLQQNSQNLLESLAPNGYLDIFPICASQQTVPITP